MYSTACSENSAMTLVLLVVVRPLLSKWYTPQLVRVSLEDLSDITEYILLLMAVSIQKMKDNALLLKAGGTLARCSRTAVLKLLIPWAR